MVSVSQSSPIPHTNFKPKHLDFVTNLGVTYKQDHHSKSHGDYEYYFVLMVIRSDSVSAITQSRSRSIFIS